MGLYSLNLDRLSEFTGRAIEDLKKETYDALETMIADMEKQKFLEQNRKNSRDEEYERLVLKFFTPVKLLRHWFTDREIVLACANTGVTESGICGEVHVEPGRKCWYPGAEFIRTSVEAVKQYDAHGRELMERSYEKRDVYRVANQYQGTRHGQVVLNLLYGRYPELSKYGFDAYSMDGVSGYEIYPKNHIYVPFAALMGGDVDWILNRNREYCAWYNNGRMSTAECEKAFREDEAREMFDIIRRVGENERSLGHTGIEMMESGARVTAGGLITKKVSKSGYVALLMKNNKNCADKSEPFKLATAAPYAADRLIAEFMEMMPGYGFKIIMAHNTDSLREHAVELRGTEKDIPGFVVHDTFGTLSGRNCKLILRVNCPELMER